MLVQVLDKGQIMAPCVYAMQIERSKCVESLPAANLAWRLSPAPKAPPLALVRTSCAYTQGLEPETARATATGWLSMQPIAPELELLDEENLAAFFVGNGAAFDGGNDAPVPGGHGQHQSMPRRRGDERGGVCV